MEEARNLSPETVSLFFNINDFEKEIKKNL